MLEDSFEVFTKPNPEIDAAFAMPGDFFGRGLMEAMPKLRVIATNTTGRQHIDEAEAALRGIEVFSLHAHEIEHVTPTAEHAIGLMLALTRNLVPANASVKARDWSRWEFAGEKMLSRSTVGVIGYGRLGRRVASALAAMGALIVVIDEKQGVGRLADVWACDIVTIHIPPARIIDREFLSRFRGYLVNTSRGEVVDMDAVLGALNAGTLKGYATDVIEGENEPGFKVPGWVTHPKVLVTPHIGGSTKDAWEETQRIVIEKLVCASSG